MLNHIDRDLLGRVPAGAGRDERERQALSRVIGIGPMIPAYPVVPQQAVCRIFGSSMQPRLPLTQTAAAGRSTDCTMSSRGALLMLGR
jgi:hypothetical protein